MRKRWQSHLNAHRNVEIRKTIRRLVTKSTSNLINILSVSFGSINGRTKRHDITDKLTFQRRRYLCPGDISGMEKASSSYLTCTLSEKNSAFNVGEIRQMEHITGPDIDVTSHDVTGNLTVCSISCLVQQQRKHRISALAALCKGNPHVTSGLSSRRTSNAGRVSMFWRHPVRMYMSDQ